MTKPKLTIGMATFQDVEGVYWTVHNLILDHPEVIDQIEIIVVDNDPTGPQAASLTNFLGLIHGGIVADNHRSAHPHSVRYIPSPENSGTSAPRERIFAEAAGDYVMCIDCHVKLVPNSIKRLLDYYEENPETNDLIQGPLMYDDHHSISTHFDDRFRNGMQGTWATDERGLDIDGEVFPIHAQGLGLFSCRKAAWQGFNPLFREFGGEEVYIHNKFRMAGFECLCLPALRWLHRFMAPGGGRRYTYTTEGKVRNYIIGYLELGLPLDRLRKHWVEGINEDANEPRNTDNLLGPLAWEALSNNPAAYPPTGCTACQTNADNAARFDMFSLEDLFAQAANTPSDINEHCNKLRELATGAEIVIEFGMRHGVSTVAILAGQPRVFKTRDLVQTAISDKLKTKQGDTDFNFMQGDSLAVPPEVCDLLFIDTRHTGVHLNAELNRHAELCRGRIAMHDTQIYGEVGEDGGPGLLVGLREFLRTNKDWTVIYHTNANHGFTVISRLESDKKKLPGALTLAANFTKALMTHVVSGAKDATLVVLESRLSECMMCDQRNNNNCGVCGCDIESKAKWAESICPLGKWEVK